MANYYWSVLRSKPTPMRRIVRGEALTVYRATLTDPGAVTPGRQWVEVTGLFCARLGQGPRWLRKLCARPLNARQVSDEMEATFEL